MNQGNTLIHCFSNILKSHWNPSIRNSPESAGWTPASIFIKVLLPAPFSPISERTSPFARVKETPSGPNPGNSWSNPGLREASLLVGSFTRICQVQPFPFSWPKTHRCFPWSLPKTLLPDRWRRGYFPCGYS